MRKGQRSLKLGVLTKSDFGARSDVEDQVALVIASEEDIVVGTDAKGAGEKQLSAISDGHKRCSKSAGPQRGGNQRESDLIIHWRAVRIVLVRQIYRGKANQFEKSNWLASLPFLSGPKSPLADTEGEIEQSKDEMDWD